MAIQYTATQKVGIKRSNPTTLLKYGGKKFDGFAALAEPFGFQRGGTRGDEGGALLVKELLGPGAALPRHTTRCLWEGGW